MRLVLAQILLMLATAAAFAGDCTPRFYQAEPRDDQWYYATGKAADASQARDNALRRLAVKVTGRESSIAEGILTGWEQDDHGECDGVYYVLIRIRQDSVLRNLAAEAKGFQASAASTPTQVTSNVTFVASEHFPALFVVFFGFMLACL
ncbi:MAG: hypothetical protein KGK30_05020, partial [Elusimicrobia bacterium]|nr:hypothetical protein [Elusimicrobiota bacterium]